MFDLVFALLPFLTYVILHLIVTAVLRGLVALGSLLDKAQAAVTARLSSPPPVIPTSAPATRPQVPPSPPQAPKVVTPAAGPVTRPSRQVREESSVYYEFLPGNQALRYPVSWYADECVSGRAIGLLRDKGIDVQSVYQARLAGYPDPAQLDYSGCARRVLITHDTDFLQLYEDGERAHCGILFMLQGSTPREILSVVRELGRRLNEQPATHRNPCLPSPNPVRLSALADDGQEDDYEDDD